MNFYLWITGKILCDMDMTGGLGLPNVLIRYNIFSKMVRKGESGSKMSKKLSTWFIQNQCKGWG